MSKQPKLSWYSVTVAEEDNYVDGKQIEWALCTTERIANSLRGCVTQWSNSMKIFPGDILDIQKQT